MAQYPQPRVWFLNNHNDTSGVDLTRWENMCIVRIRYPVVPRNSGDRRNLHAYRRGRILLDFEQPIQEYFQEPVVSTAFQDWLRRAIAEDMLQNVVRYHFSLSEQEDDPILGGDVEQQMSNISIDGVDFELPVDLCRARGLDPILVQQAQSQGRQAIVEYLRNRRMFANINDPHHSFFYWIPGCSMKTLEKLVPEEWIEEDASCHGTCAYDMLERNRTNVTAQRPEGIIPKIYRRENVNKWMNENVRNVGSIFDGLTPNDIHAHAVAHGYNHLAMDLTQSKIHMHIKLDADPTRNRHHKTMAYMVAGNHCHVITDNKIIEAIVKSHLRDNQKHRSLLVGFQSSTMNLNVNSNLVTQKNEDQPRYPTKRVPKRKKGLDKFLKANNVDAFTESQFAGCLSYVDGEDIEFDDQLHARSSGLLPQEWKNDETRDGDVILFVYKKKQVQYPHLTDMNRFHYFKSDEKDFIKERLFFEYQEGEDPSLLHYNICTDHTDVEFLYEYILRVLKCDPQKYVKTYNGKCREIRVKNVRWVASPNIDEITKIHAILHPKEPFKLCSVASYAYHLLQKTIYKMSKTFHSLWACASIYPPSLHRVMDNSHPCNAPKILLRNFKGNEPYSCPLGLRQNVQNGLNGNVQEKIPEGERRRIDIIRSYTSILYHQKDEYPIHDLTNKLEVFDATNEKHTGIPIGTYLVTIPDRSKVMNNRKLRDGYEILCCLKPGSKRTMGHKMVRALLDRKLLEFEDINLICATNPDRQSTYGQILVEALKDMVRTIYTHSDLKRVWAKNMMNFLIGLFNGTSMPTSGSRYVFKDINELFCLLFTSMAENPKRKPQIFHRTGMDTTWGTQYDYYELDFSGSGYRHFHFQPIYNQVLEEQCIKVYDLAIKIPLANLIQIKCDAIEYRLDKDHAKVVLSKYWAKEIERTIIPLDTYVKAEPEEILNELMGKFKEEPPKQIKDAGMYYWNFDKQEKKGPGTYDYHSDHPSFFLSDTPDYIIDWTSQLRQAMPNNQPNNAEVMKILIKDFLQSCDMENETMRPTSYAGMIVTGAAGTGKTYFTKQLYQEAINKNMKVVRTAFTHAACIQMGFDAVTLHSFFGMDDITDSRYLFMQNMRVRSHLRHLDVDLLIVDEISMIPYGLLEILYLFHAICPRVRICLVGDFNQLPPVEARFGNQIATDEHGEEYTYWDNTDIFPAIVYDRVTNQHGWWLQLTECRRTNDPLLMKLVKEPKTAGHITEDEFPPLASGAPVWRFLCWRNATRKAANLYCMYKYLELFPEQRSVRLNLSDVWIYHQKSMADIRERKRQCLVDGSESSVGTTERRMATSFSKEAEERDKDWLNKYMECNKPRHWKYLQDFTYAVGMEVVCRCTIKRRTFDDKNAESSVHEEEANVDPDNAETKLGQCVNQRRAQIVDINLNSRIVKIQWTDKLASPNDLNSTEDSPSKEAGEDGILELNFYDFTFHFVPGFCITVHMSQGETIKDQHYAILDWTEIRNKPKMAYVAVTRGQHSRFLHLIARDRSPWMDIHTSRLRDNLLFKLYHSLCAGKDDPIWYAQVTLEHLMCLAESTPDCPLCGTHLRYTNYVFYDHDQFWIRTSEKKPINQLTIFNTMLTCKVCPGGKHSKLKTFNRINEA